MKKNLKYTFSRKSASSIETVDTSESTPLRDFSNKI